MLERHGEHLLATVLAPYRTDEGCDAADILAAAAEAGELGRRIERLGGDPDHPLFPRPRVTGGKNAPSSPARPAADSSTCSWLTAQRTTPAASQAAAKRGWRWPRK